MQHAQLVSKLGRVRWYRTPPLDEGDAFQAEIAQKGFKYVGAGDGPGSYETYYESEDWVICVRHSSDELFSHKATESSTQVGARQRTWFTRGLERFNLYHPDWP